MASQGRELPYSLSYDRLSLSVRFLTALYPFEEWAFINTLPEFGYTLSERIPLPPFGARVAMRGEVGAKGGLHLVVNTDLRTLELAADDVTSLLDEFDSLESMLLDKFKFNSRENAHYYELLADVSASANRDPLQCLAERFESFELVKELGGILEVPVTNFGMRLVPPGTEPNNSDWFDIRLEPEILRPHSHYSILTVYRQSNRDKVFEFARRLQETFERIIARLEGA